MVSAPSKPMAADANAKLAELIEGAPKSVAGERLNVELLRRFYARRGFAPVWETRQAPSEFTDGCDLARRQSWPRP